MSTHLCNRLSVRGKNCGLCLYVVGGIKLYQYINVCAV